MAPQTGQAGNDETRSDCMVRITPAEGRGLDLQIDSKVGPYYGDSIREQTLATLAAAGVEHARVELRDRGALPFALEARVEAAARLAGYMDGKPDLPEAAPLPEASDRNRLRRSRLYIPGNDPKLMIGAGLHGADGVILDLEDSVHPGAKDAARFLVRNALCCIDFGGSERMVRINPEPLAEPDLAAVVPARPDLILIPKVEDPAQVARVDAAINRILGGTGEHRPLWLMPILETGKGIENAFAIARASERIAALTIGLEDYTADLGVVKTRDGSETLWARSRLVNAAAAAGVQAIDSVYGDVADEEGLRTWGARSRALGFQGMGCVHPRQIPVVHEGYSPSEEEVARALNVVAAFQEAEKQGLAVVSLGSKMIDPPVVERARRLVEQARKAGRIREDES